MLPWFKWAFSIAFLPKVVVSGNKYLRVACFGILRHALRKDDDELSFWLLPQILILCFLNILGKWRSVVFIFSVVTLLKEQRHVSWVDDTFSDYLLKMWSCVSCFGLILICDIPPLTESQTPEAHLILCLYFIDTIPCHVFWYKIDEYNIQHDKICLIPPFR